MPKIRVANIVFPSWIELQALQQVARYEQRNGARPGDRRSRHFVNSQGPWVDKEKQEPPD